MKLLFDTHSFIWFFEGDQRLPLRMRRLIADDGNELLLSIASLWEMAIKIRIGKLNLAQPFETVIHENVTLKDIRVYGVVVEHTFAVAKLPLHHRDLFDRMLAAQSLTDNLPLISADPLFDPYGVNRIW